MFDYGFHPAAEQKKKLLNLLLQKFVLHRDGNAELRFKLPVNETHVAETILTLSSNDTTFGNINYESIRNIDNLPKED